MKWLLTAICMHTALILLFSSIWVACSSPHNINGGINTCYSHEVSYMAGKLQNKDILWRINVVETTIRCAAYCLRDIACTCFFYNSESRMCQGHSDMVFQMENAVTSIGTKLFNTCRGKRYKIHQYVLSQFTLECQILLRVSYLNVPNNWKSF